MARENSQNQQQQQQGLLQMEEEGNRWEQDLVILMSTIMIDKDRVGGPYLQKKEPKGSFF